MRATRALLALTAAIAAGVFTTFPANALSCSADSLAVPGDGAQEVPLDTRIWCYTSDRDMPTPLEEAQDGGMHSGVRLYDAEGDAVPGGLTRLLIGSRTVDVLTPASPLEPKAGYRLECTGLNGWPQEREFMTGTIEASPPPVVPDTSNYEVNVGSGLAWGPSFAVVFPHATAPSTLIVATLEDGSDLFPVSPSGSVSGLSYYGADTMDRGSFRFGRGPCGGEFSEAGLGVSADIRLGAFSLDGQFSGWSEAVSVQFPTEFMDEEGEPSEPAKPVEPGEPAKPVEPGEPAKPVEPGEPAKPVEPGEPTEFVAPGGPIEIVDVTPDSEGSGSGPEPSHGETDAGRGPGQSRLSPVVDAKTSSEGCQLATVGGRPGAGWALALLFGLAMGVRRRR